MATTVQTFGKLKRRDLREVWRHEASDFTPWLAQHLDDLSDVLGVELELQSSEAPVGTFSLDILAHDLSRDRPVIIENQLEQTDHDHLGKLLTYAAGYDASIVIWISREIRDEHRQALDWLNQHTDADVDFFGIVVEVLQIDDSKLAYNFKLVASPNEWRKRSISILRGDVSERREAYRVFFQALLDDLRDKHHFTGARKAQPHNWCSFASGMTGYTYAANFAQGRKVRAELYIDRSDADANKAVFDALYSDRDAIEPLFESPLAWERLDGKRASRIAIYRPGSIEDDEQTLREVEHWLVDQLLRLKKVFGPRLQKRAAQRLSAYP